MKKNNCTLSLCSALLALLVLIPSVLCSCGRKNAVMKIGDYEVSFEHYRYLYMNVRTELEAQGIGGDELDSEARETTLTSLIHTAAIDTMAKERKLSLSDEEQTTIDDYVAAAVLEYENKEAYLAALEEAFMDEKFFRYALELQQLEAKLRAYTTDEYTGELAASDSTVESDVYENFFYVAQILIKNDMVDSPEENLEIAKTALDRAALGEDFDALIKELGEDAGGGYYCFTSGQLLEKIEEAAKETPEGQIYPNVIETEAGYHVIKRLPIDPEYVNENFSELREAYLARRFNELLSETIAKLKVKNTELYDSLTEDALIQGVLAD